MTTEDNSKVALVTGITGQDGSYLAELLLEKGYTVWMSCYECAVLSIAESTSCRIDPVIAIHHEKQQRRRRR